MTQLRSAEDRTSLAPRARPGNARKVQRGMAGR
jgi:hypothetical protein